jgi:GNAT superfamily N-acetyltransferase
VRYQRGGLGKFIGNRPTLQRLFQTLRIVWTHEYGGGTSVTRYNDPSAEAPPLMYFAAMSRHLLRADLEHAAAVLARAFTDDPVMSWLFPDEATRTEDLAVLHGACLHAGHGHGHIYGLGRGAALQAAAIWAPPEVEPFDDADVESIGALLYGRYGDEGVGRLSAFAEAAGAHHPTDPHFYLFIVGVEPSQRGQGLGASLLVPVLARCDADGLPAYLESTNPRNLTLYRRLGFETRHEFYPEGGPLLTGMWREPR